MTIETDLMRAIPMEQASSCEHCGVENDREDFIYHEGDWICPDCFNKTQKPTKCDDCGKDDCEEIFPTADLKWVCRECFDRIMNEPDYLASNLRDPIN